MLTLTVQSLINTKAQLEGAFKPFQCSAFIYAAGEKLRFKVFDKDYDIAAEMSDLSVKDLLDDAYRAEIIEKTRSKIMARRLRLNLGEEAHMLWPSVTTRPRGAG
jgi:hypothetical protein